MLRRGRPAGAGALPADRPSGRLPFLPRLGSRLYLLGRERPSERLSAAWQYAAEALSEEDVSITDLALNPAGEGRIELAIHMDYEGTELSAVLTL